MSFASMLMFCRITIICLFMLSAGGKALDIAAFQATISNFRLLPEKWSKAAAWTFLAGEVIVVLLVAIGGSVLLPGFLLAAALLVVFAAALLVVLRRKMGGTCNCFGRTERRISPYDVARNSLFILCSLMGIWASVNPLITLSVYQFFLIIPIAISFVVLAINLSDVVETLRQPFHIH